MALLAGCSISPAAKTEGHPEVGYSQVPLPVTLWYAFHFSVVDGKPVVGFQESRKTSSPR